MVRIFLANFNPTDPQTWVPLTLGLVLLFYMMFRTRKKRRDPLDDSPGKLSLAQQRSVERQMQNLLVEMAEMARQISAQLDTRAARLQQLIADADQRMAMLQNLQGDTGTTPGSFPRSVRDEPATTDDPRHADVYKLADAGRTSADIAAALHRPSGEVELILALRPKSNRVSGT